MVCLSKEMLRITDSKSGEGVLEKGVADGWYVCGGGVYKGL